MRPVEQRSETLFLPERVKLKYALTSPFGVNPFLLELARSGQHITPDEFKDIVGHARVVAEQKGGNFDLQTILPYIPRGTSYKDGIEEPGLHLNFLGHPDFANAESISSFLTLQGNLYLSRLDDMDREGHKPIKQQVLDTLSGHSLNLWLPGFRILDEFQSDLIQKVRQIRQQSPLALTIREANLAATRYLFQHPDRLHTVFDSIIGRNPSILKPEEPYVWFYMRPDATGNFVSSVDQLIIFPDIDSIYLDKKTTVGNLLRPMVADEFSRGSEQPVNTPVGFINALGRIGQGLVRYPIEMIDDRHQNLQIRPPNEQIVTTGQVINELLKHSRHRGWGWKI